MRCVVADRRSTRRAGWSFRTNTLLLDPFHAPVLGAAVLGAVVSDGRRLAVAFGGQLVGLDASLHKRGHHGLRTLLREPLVRFRCADVVGMPAALSMSAVEGSITAGGAATAAHDEARLRSNVLRPVC